MRRVVRVRSEVASLSSRRDRARLTPEVVCPRCTAAALRVPLSMTVTKIFRSSELISIVALLLRYFHISRHYNGIAATVKAAANVRQRRTKWR
ncbi:hypothetical protein D9M68_1004030 [compost metagenome]